ncbi:hypothetical protein HUT11_35655 (plasmid) [Streptomyces seoulensis]|nr:hypothetical protein HUT11_35655 [Streptomyces seoulensis]
MNGPHHTSDLDDVLDTLAELGDDDIDRIITGFRNLARRARTGHLDLNTTQVLLAAVAASPDSADLVGACAFTVAEITEHNPALTALTDEARKEAIRAGQEAAFRLTDHYLREPASNANAALDVPHPPTVQPPAISPEQRQHLHDRLDATNRWSRNRPT